MTDIKNIVALCMKYMFYFILLMILFSFCINICEYFNIKFIYINSESLFFISALLVCISPFMWSILFTLGYLYKKSYKATLLGVLLIIMLIFSFLAKDI